MTRAFGLAAVVVCGLAGWAWGQTPREIPISLPPTLPPPGIISLPAPSDSPPSTPATLPPSPATLPPPELTIPIAGPGPDTGPSPKSTPATGPAPAPATKPPATKSEPPPLPAPVPTECATTVQGKPIDVVGQHITVTTGDGDFKLILGGAVVADFLYSTHAPVAPGTPFFLAPEAPFGFRNNTFDATARQTNVYAFFTGPEVFDFKTGGFIFVNLYDNSIIQDRYGVLPINAFGELRNDDWRFAAGLQMDVFNPLNPTVLPFSYLGTSGNTGLFRGQARIERFLHDRDDVHVTMTLAASEPVPTTVNDQLRISEDNGLPNLEGRVAIGLGPMTGFGIDAHRPVEAGVSALCGQLRTVQGPKKVVADVWGLGSDIRWAADPRWGFQGEVYMGQGLGTYGASALQNVNPTTFRAIRTAGFWVEGFYYWCPDAVHTHIGYGIDDPLDGDVGLAIPLRNETYYITTIWDVTKAFRVGLQASYLRTAYPVAGNVDGFIFQTQFMWKF